ncbi:MAG: hypothetical protein E8D46_01870 [Nitrospira sp.]|nr:hypothetical protein [Nitrospira sp.]TKB75594.1 MAG: hypothetical protein E8D46_01870 [Nitrospira sp.]
MRAASRALARAEAASGGGLGTGQVQPTTAEPTPLAQFIPLLRIETDRRQLHFATLAPSAHAERYTS